MEVLKIGLLGLGTVGQGVWNITKRNNFKMESYLNKKIDIKKVLVNNIEKTREVDVPKEILTKQINEIIDDPEIKIVVELIGGINPAYEYIKSALKKGKHVVTANKALIATHGEELLALARGNNVELRYEASVGGGIPIIVTLLENLSANNIDEVLGIVNGTTNYILTQMTNKKVSFNDALKDAQDKGFAEADPTSDIEGQDAVFKLSILSAIAFGIQLSPKDIPSEGITKIAQQDIKYSSDLGYVIKLLATAKRSNNAFIFHVQPTLVPKNHPLANVENEFNALFVRGDAVGEIMLYGKGAGALPTGSAVLSDVLSIGKLIGTEYNANKIIINENKPLEIIGEGTNEYYIRLQVFDEPGVLGKIAATFGNFGISLKSVVQIDKGSEYIPLVFITHEAKRKLLDKALGDISKFDCVNKISNIMRVENLK